MKSQTELSEELVAAFRAEIMQWRVALSHAIKNNPGNWVPEFNLKEAAQKRHAAENVWRQKIEEEQLNAANG